VMTISVMTKSVMTKSVMTKSVMAWFLGVRVLAVVAAADRGWGAGGGG
jgi:hypothetical protein